MPNHCYNRVQISNDAEDNSKQFDELVAIFESQKPFSKIIPIPNFLEIPNEDGELPVVVEHKNDKGEVIFTTSEFPKSKKGDDFCTTYIEEDYAEFTFNTAWGPPEGIFDKIRENYPDVGISWFYDEPGCELAGYLPN